MEAEAEEGLGRSVVFACARNGRILFAKGRLPFMRRLVVFYFFPFFVFLFFLFQQLT